MIVGDEMADVAQTDSKKQSKADVAYRPGDDTNACGVCVNFASPNACTLVAGVVEATGLCNLFQSLEQEPDANAAMPGGDLMSQLFGGTPPPGGTPV